MSSSQYHDQAPGGAWSVRTATSAVSAASKVSALSTQDRNRLLGKLSRRVHGVFASAKNARSIPWASREQRDLMFLLELDTKVVGYEVLPESMSTTVAGQERTHVPAFGVVTDRGPVIMDVFATQVGTSSRVRSLVDAVGAAYTDRGIRYRALLGKDIRLEPRFGNARWACAGQVRFLDPETVFHVVEALSGGTTLTLAGVEAALDGHPDAIGTVLAMAARRQVTLDLSAREPLGIVASLHAGAGR